jgi:glutamyl-tRNA reductase
VSETLVVGLSHKSAPMELRERCRVESVPEALQELQAFGREALILNTCNRFEVYVEGVEEPGPIVGWIARRAGAEQAELEPHAYVRRGYNAWKHLFFVSAALDSLVVGETQIRAQVKAAYEQAIRAGTVGPALHRLCQAALRVSKEIAERTGVGRGNVSVAGAAADLAERVFGNLGEAAVLVIGAGETAELLMNHLASRSVSRFRVLNRTPERARELVGRFGGVAGGLDELDRDLAEADVLVAAAGGEQPLIGSKVLRAAVRKRRGRPIVVIDIAVPRCVDPRVDSLDNVYRYDMEALTEVTQDALRHRRKDFIQCCTLVDAAALRVAAEQRAHAAGGAIAELERTFREVAADEIELLERRLPGLGAQERDKVRLTIHRIVRKLLHMPVQALRESDPEEEQVIRRAFGGPRRGHDG